MSASREAHRLEIRLRSDVVDDVEIRWDSTARPGWRWHVFWPDGPTVKAMRAHVERITAGSEHLDPSKIVYARVVQPRSFALAMVRNLRLHQPPLGTHQSLWQLETELVSAEFPEQGSESDRRLATVLCRLANFLEAEMPAVLDRLGLDGLLAELEAAASTNVVPMHRYRR